MTRQDAGAREAAAMFSVGPCTVIQPPPVCPRAAWNLNLVKAQL